MHRNIISIAILGLLIPATVAAQQRDSTQARVQEDLEQALEDFDIEEGEAGSEQLIQLLQELMANPININQADVNELREVPGINLKTGHHTGPKKNLSNCKSRASVGLLTRKYSPM